MRIEGKIVDILKKEIFEGSVTFENGVITAVTPHQTQSDQYILPGFVDSHMHIESSMLTPATFGREALRHGTVAIITDPHEIANVCGVAGIEFMVSKSAQTPLKIYFTAPSCVPATPFESSGAVIDAQTLEPLLEQDQFVGLSEMMDYPGVVARDPRCMDKIAVAQRHGKPVDGHSPMLEGVDLQCYIDAGISTDHECDTLENALHKMSRGMIIQIREGSSAKNFDELIPLLGIHPELVMFCSDDFKATDLVKGYINRMVARAVALEYNLFDVLRAATYNPVKHYGLKVGMLRVGDPADFLVCDDLTRFEPQQTWVNGMRVDQLEYTPQYDTINNFHALPIDQEAISDPLIDGAEINVIGVINNQLTTKHLVRIVGVDSDFQKIVVLNRYVPDAVPAVGYVSGFHFRKCAVASTIAHDSHNIIATGSSDRLIVEAINRVIEMQGGVAVCLEDAVTHSVITEALALPIAGLMSNVPIKTLVIQYDNVNDALRRGGCRLESPLMTLSFMALPVIPSLKITDKGLFDSEKFVHIGNNCLRKR